MNSIIQKWIQKFKSEFKNSLVNSDCMNCTIEKQKVNSVIQNWIQLFRTEFSYWKVNKFTKNEFRSEFKNSKVNLEIRISRIFLLVVFHLLLESIKFTFLYNTILLLSKGTSLRIPKIKDALEYLELMLSLLVFHGLYKVSR